MGTVSVRLYALINTVQVRHEARTRAISDRFAIWPSGEAGKGPFCGCFYAEKMI